MGWINAFLASRGTGVADPADSWSGNVINGGVNHAHNATPGQYAVGREDVQIPEEVKRRQIALITRYVMTVRAR